jgi:hypothetical protein
MLVGVSHMTERATNEDPYNNRPHGNKNLFQGNQQGVENETCVHTLASHCTLALKATAPVNTHTTLGYKKCYHRRGDSIYIASAFVML